MYSRSGYYLISAATLAALAALLFSTVQPVSSQSGRQKSAQPTPAANTNTNPRPRAIRSATPPPMPANNNTGPDTEDVVRVTSHLVPVPTTVLNARGVAITNLRLEDFELNVDGQPKPISELSRADTPVRMAMLFDNSGSLMNSREFEKGA